MRNYVELAADHNEHGTAHFDVEREGSEYVVYSFTDFENYAADAIMREPTEAAAILTLQCLLSLEGYGPLRLA